MADQLSFSSPKEDGIKRAVKHASRAWIEAGVFVGEHLARKQSRITSADIDLEMVRLFPNIRTHEKRAMAGVMRRLKTLRVIEATADFIADPRPNCHEQNKRVWRSLIFLKAA